MSTAAAAERPVAVASRRKPVLTVDREKSFTLCTEGSAQYRAQVVTLNGVNHGVTVSRFWWCPNKSDWLPSTRANVFFPYKPWIALAMAAPAITLAFDQMLERIDKQKMPPADYAPLDGPAAPAPSEATSNSAAVPAPAPAPPAVTPPTTGK
jgi:hypothetical protein